MTPSHPNELDFRVLFESVPDLYLILSPSLNIIAVNNAYANATMTKRENIVGRHLFEIFPDNPDDKEATGVSNLRASLERVLKHRAPDTMAVQKYDIRKPESEGGAFEERFWSPMNIPTFSPTGELLYIIHRAEDVTEFIRLKKKGQEQKKEHQELQVRAESMEREIYLRGQEIQKTNKELEAANRAKSDFLAKMSHDIRTPLNGIIGMADLMLGTKQSEQQKRYTQILKSSANSLSTLINDILDFSKIEAGKLELAEVDFNLYSAIEEVVTTLSYQASKKGLELICYINPKVPFFVHGDPDRLWQILVNLINNAVKFTESGQVVIRVLPDANDEQSVVVYFEVTDTGIGIPRDRLDRLFEAFSQADVTTTRKYGGTGLGLAISKQLVNLMGGKIGVNSNPEQGSTFWFTIRFKTCNTEMSLNGYNLKALQDFNILIVDDNAVNLEILYQQITDLGLRAKTAQGSKEAMHFLEQAGEEHYPTLALIDYQMPCMSGLELGRFMAGHERHKEIPLILLTSVDNEFDMAEMKKSGFSGLMTKPVRQSMLFEAIQKAFLGIEQIKPRVELSEETAGRELSDVHILVAEDNEINQIVISEILTASGYRCDLVADGKSAVEKAMSGEYDLIIMDCEMPIKDGIQATREIRQLEKANNTGLRIPIIALTANAQLASREECFSAGMNEFCSKPVNQEQLLEILDKQLGLSRRRSASGGDREKVDLPFDVETVLGRCMNKPATARLVIEKFDEQIKSDLERLKVCIGDSNFKEVAAIAHALRGAAKLVAAERIVELSEQLELMSKGGDLSFARACLDELESAIAKCVYYIPEALKTIAKEKSETDIS